MRKCCLFLIIALPCLLFAFDSNIPVLDLQEFQNPKTKAKFLAELEEALRDVGFFALLNTGVDPEVLEHAYTASKAFFALDFPDKMQINDPANNGQRGYVLSESAKGEATKDFKEFLHIGRELPDAKLEQIKGFPNLWPEKLNIKVPLLTLFHELEVGVMPLQEAFAALVKKPAGYFSEMTREGNCLIRATRYPANPPKGHIWSAEHTDIDLFTILPPSTASELQLKRADGKWVDIIVPQGAFVINAGDMLENLSNGLFRSPAKRVVDSGHRHEWYSLVFFVHARGTDDMSPLPYCVKRSGGMQRYPDGVVWELLSERLADLGLASRDMLEELGESGFLEKKILLGRESPDAMWAVHKAGFASRIVKKRLSQLKQ